jgi:uncharacterized protein
MPRSYLILHGMENHRPPQHWHFLLAARLVESGEQVLYPQLPDADAPRFPVWEAVLHRLLSETAGTERVVICHSLGCLLWLRAAAGIAPDERAHRLLLVAPPDSQLIPESAAAFRLHELDLDAVRRSVDGAVTIVCSNDDTFNPDCGALEMYGEPLGVAPVQIRDGGHFIPESGYGMWPSLVEWCLDPAVQIVPAGLSARRRAR